MKKSLFTAVLGAMLAMGMMGAAVASSHGWMANDGTTYEGGVVTLDNSDGPTSFEHTDLDVAVANGDAITFEYRVDGGDDLCVGGTPRVFIQGGAYNTHDETHNDGFPCELRTSGPDDDGWRTVTGTVAGVSTGTAGYTGIVNDNQAHVRVIEVRNLTIGGVSVLAPLSTEDCKDGGWQHGAFKNQGQCVSSFAKTK